MNILITGGAGYVGSVLVNQLQNNPEVEKITVYDNLSTDNYGLFTSAKLNSSKVKFVEADILDAYKLKKEIKNIDVVYHLAGQTNQNPAIESHSYEQINHWGTSEVLNAVEQSDVKKVIFLSSTDVFGSGEVENELSEPAPKSFYAHSKFRAEEQIRRLWDKKQCFIIRASEIFGFSPASQYDSLLNKIFFQANFKGRIQIPGNGRDLKSFVSIDKTVEALTSFLSTDSKSEIFHLSDHSLQVLDVVEVMQEIYPALEFIFINPHLQLEDLAVKPSEKLNSFVKLKTNSLKEELELFKSHFSF